MQSLNNGEINGDFATKSLRKPLQHIKNSMNVLLSIANDDNIFEGNLILCWRKSLLSKMSQLESLRSLNFSSQQFQARWGNQTLNPWRSAIPRPQLTSRQQNQPTISKILSHIKGYMQVYKYFYPRICKYKCFISMLHNIVFAILKEWN